jgi:hypothetical protein
MATDPSGWKKPGFNKKVGPYHLNTDKPMQSPGFKSRRGLYAAAFTAFFP